MRPSMTRDEISRIRLRHRGYRLLLLSITLILLLQPLSQRWSLLSPLLSITLALVMMLFLTRYSPLQARRRILYSLGAAAIVSELLWLVVLVSDFSLALHLAIAHLLIWSLFIGTFLLRKVKALMLEPYVTLAVVMGAAAGYLLIGYLGGFLLHTLLLWQPSAFNAAVVAPDFNPQLHPLKVFPAMVLASFGSLTTVGSAIARPGQLIATTGGMVITLTGQLYVAVLIALILGRFHRRGAS